MTRSMGKSFVVESVVESVVQFAVGPVGLVGCTDIVCGWAHRA
ncbi:hypothetical protein WKI68_20635 [Streptomyces sp. MS1.HAVA.3]|uniref:Uncharacterized protein n=1 Tax=Streptomyces caledonius TaxID=3134107 RepID=A0ABU8U5H6_9ACTN